ncbi:MAG: DUF3784 domain-containing protein [Clostridiales bacterium]|jgi:hypothetical protein|nr:DUF3784 domain-containing protein [Clostridiales bacterium]
MSAISICLCVLFIVLGIFFSLGKGGFLIAGFNTMKKEEQEKYNKTALCKFMGKIMFALAGSIVLMILSDCFKKTFLLTAGIALFALALVFMLIYINTDNRFKK